MSKEIIPIQSIAQKILSLRGERVLLDRDLANLYGVETGALNQAVKRNTNRFPAELEKRVGERTRLACWRWRPRHCELLSKRYFSASRRKVHASRVRSPIHK